MSEKEVWKPIQNFEGYYEVSSLGRVRSLDRRVKGKNNSKIFKKGKILIAQKGGSGYLKVTLSVNGKLTGKEIHRLVAKAFLPNPENKPEVNHKTGDKTCNTVETLEWCTALENTNHAIKLGLIGKKGEDNPRAKLTNEQVKEIRKKHVPYDIAYGTKALANKYGVNIATIQNIVHNRTYKNVE